MKIEKLDKILASLNTAMTNQKKMRTLNPAEKKAFNDDYVKSLENLAESVGGLIAGGGQAGEFVEGDAVDIEKMVADAVEKATVELNKDVNSLAIEVAKIIENRPIIENPIVTGGESIVIDVKADPKKTAKNVKKSKSDKSDDIFGGKSE